MVSVDHPNAQFYFDRDVDCVRTFFRRRYVSFFEDCPICFFFLVVFQLQNELETFIYVFRFNYESELYPKFEAVTRKYNLDVELNASGFTPRMSKAYDKVSFQSYLVQRKISYYYTMVINTFH